MDDDGGGLGGAYLAGGGGAPAVMVVSRLGTEGAFPSVGGLARLLCPAGFNLGMPPAKRLPSCGGPPAPDAGTAGEEDALPIPLVAPIPPLLPLGFASTTGALRSFVSAFFRLFPA